MKHLFFLCSALFFSISVQAQDLAHEPLVVEKPRITYFHVNEPAKAHIQIRGKHDIMTLDIPSNTMLRVEASMEMNPSQQHHLRDNKRTFLGDLIVSTAPLPPRPEPDEITDQHASNSADEAYVVVAPKATIIPMTDLFADASFRMEIKDAILVFELGK